MTGTDANLLGMLKRGLYSLAAGLLLVIAARAQNDAKSLEAELKGKQLELRNYSADRIAWYRWMDGKLASDPVATHTVAVFVTRSLKLKHGVVEIEGERSTLIHDAKKNGLALSGKIPMSLKVDLQGASPDVVLPQLRQAIFFEDANAALAAIPPPMSTFLPFGNKRNDCECASILKDGHWLRVEMKNPTYSHPIPVWSVEPSFSESARRSKTSGIITSFLVISEGGKVADVWLANSVGSGLDEETVKAVRQYVFKPAQYEGHAVGTVVSIEINFPSY